MNRYFACIWALFFLIFPGITYLPAQSVSALLKQYQVIQDSLDIGAWQLLDDEQRAFEEKKLQEIQASLQAKRDSYTTVEQIEADILLFQIQNRLDALEFDQHRLPLNAEGGFLAGVVYSYQRPVSLDKVGLGKYAEELHKLPSYFEGHMAHMREGIKTGHTHPTLILDNCLKLVNQLLQTPPEQSFFVQRLGKDEATKQQILPLVKDKVYGAYKTLGKFLLEEYRPHCKQETGVGAIPGGADYYARRVRFFTTLDMTPEEVFATGKR
ncbi:MAG: DUF885 family protein, partial [Bacteroidota bacterium]